MSALTAAKAVVYPESDGEPIAENTRQAEFIVTVMGGLDDLFRDRPDVFVAMDNFWYPVEGHPEIVTAPDVYVAFGRPKGHRGSYRQWEEGGIPLTVVFEIWSPGNRTGKMREKFEFYDRHGVEEYYVYDPDRGTLEGWQRVGDRLQRIAQMRGHVSRRLTVRFEMEGDDLVLVRPDGQRFQTYLELAVLRDEAARQRDEAARKRDAYAAKLRELGVDPDTL